MSKVFYVIGATLCYVGGFAIMLCILGFLTELALEIWGENYTKLCAIHGFLLSDVVTYSLCKKEFDEWLATHEPKSLKRKYGGKA